MNPNYAMAHHWYAEYLQAMGRYDEALVEIKRAQELDPLSLIIGAVGGRIYYCDRKYDQAIANSNGRCRWINVSVPHPRSYLRHI